MRRPCITARLNERADLFAGAKPLGLRGFECRGDPSQVVVLVSWRQSIVALMV